jgi:hypothetical protein
VILFFDKRRALLDLGTFVLDSVATLQFKFIAFFFVGTELKTAISPTASPITSSAYLPSLADHGVDRETAD